MSDIAAIAKVLRYYILTTTTKAGSGHPSSCLSAADLIAGLLIDQNFRYDISAPRHRQNDRLIFSKGHAAPLFYAFWALAGGIETTELDTLRLFGSRLEGHPTKAFPFTEIPTGSLGQGLAVGVGMAMNAKYLDRLSSKIFVLLGDSELAEGSVWESIGEASFYKLNNLIGLIDMNRLGQRGQTMLGHDTATLANRIQSFGWETIVIDGHEYEQIKAAYQKARHSQEKPCMIIAKTLKGKGIALLEDKEGWHGKILSPEQLTQALTELGEVNMALRIKLPLPLTSSSSHPTPSIAIASSFAPFAAQSALSTREVYGQALVELMGKNDQIVVLDAEVSNSTHADEAKKHYSKRFFEMYIAEQHMVGVGTGLACCGKIPFISTFAAFFTRATDQLRMAGLAEANIKCVGSHAGVSIGEDGASQMGLEDIALFRTVWNSVVLYPSDAWATTRLVALAAAYQGVAYIRTTRKETPTLYTAEEQFVLGGSKVLRTSKNDEITLVAAGITLHEALEAYEQLKEMGILVRVIDLYSIKPIDSKTLQNAAIETEALIVIEDHYEAGGIGDAVRAVVQTKPVYSLAVHHLPHSGTPQELLEYEGISARAIVEKVKSIV